MPMKTVAVHWHIALLLSQGLPTLPTTHFPGMSPATLGSGKRHRSGQAHTLPGAGGFLGASQPPHIICLCQLLSFMFAQRFNNYSSLPHPSQRCLPSHLQRVNVIEYSDVGGLGWRWQEKVLGSLEVLPWGVTTATHKAQAAPSACLGTG